MAVQTPEYWKEYELIEEKTVYGNKVLIPKKLQLCWELERLRKEDREKKKQKLTDGLKRILSRPKYYDLVRVFYEIYPNEISEKETAKEE